MTDRIKILPTRICFLAQVITTMLSILFTGMFLPNAEWLLVAVPAVRNEIKYFCCPEPYPDVTFTVVIKRRTLFYLTNLILPMVIISVLTMLAFLLPAESGEALCEAERQYSNCSHFLPC